MGISLELVWVCRRPVAMPVIGGFFRSGLLPGRYEPPGRRHAGRIARFTGRGRRGRSVELERGKFGAGAQAQLAEHVAQVEVDGAGAEVQLCGGVPVGQPLPDQRGDLPLLGGELSRGGDVAATGGFAGGA